MVHLIQRKKSQNVCDGVRHFFQKFHQLRKAGVTAHLDLDAHAGTAWVGLRVQLGQVPGPVHHQDHQPHPQRRGPAYQRRQERRQAA